VRDRAAARISGAARAARIMGRVKTRTRTRGSKGSKGSGAARAAIRTLYFILLMRRPSTC